MASSRSVNRPAPPRSPGGWLAAYRFRAQPAGRPLSPEELGRLIGVSGATVRRWEAGQGRPSPDDFQNLIEALSLGPQEANFLEAAFSARSSETAPTESAFYQLRTAVGQSDSPTVVLDSLFVPRVRNSLTAAVIGMRALSLDFKHPVMELIQGVQAAGPSDRPRLEMDLGKLMRDFWLGTAALCGSPAYRRVVGELMLSPEFCERWSLLALEPFAESESLFGGAYFVDRGPQGVYRVLPMRVGLPPDYLVMEFQPHDDAARSAVANARQRVRPFVIENPSRHWSLDIPSSDFRYRREKERIDRDSPASGFESRGGRPTGTSTS